MWITMKVLVASVIVALILMAASAFSINYYLTELFDVSMFVYIRENI
jgi:hypothetical protein